MKYISLFSSAGIGCFGFKENGFECISTLELIKERMAIQKANRKCNNDDQYLCGDITDKFVEDSLYKNVKKYAPDGVDFVVATPPCQSMSTLNKKNANNLAKNSLVVKSIDMIENIKPKVFVIENVRSFLKTDCENNQGRLIKIKALIDDIEGYNIIYKVINFKEYGNNSSRPRCLVIGTRKDVREINPYLLWPSKKKPKTVGDVIQGRKVLNDMLDYDENDFLHMFRKYDVRMRPWISCLNPGETAFDNKDKFKRPHRIIDGKYIGNKNLMTNKYKRTFTDQVLPCVHTRNDLVASQYTIHPYEDRVFSISELMDFMSIPNTFVWTSCQKDICTKSHNDVKNWYKKNELNIRRTLGESVPTSIFYSIGKKYKELLSEKGIIQKSIKFESDNERKVELSAYYTYPNTCFNLVHNIDPKGVKRILEPCAGVGLLLSSIIAWRNFHELEAIIDVNEIDKEAYAFLEKNFRDKDINFTNICFTNIDHKYDLLVMNPPYGKLKTDKYKYAWKYFVDKANAISKKVSFIVPKSILSDEKLNDYRKNNLGNLNFVFDNGIKAFKGVYLETVTVVFNGKSSLVTVNRRSSISKSIFENESMWLLYANDWFLKYKDNLELNIFDMFRDRQISKKDFKPEGKIRVIKSKNIIKGEIIEKPGYDKYMDNSKYKIFDYIDKETIIIPSFTYNIRVARKPAGCVTDGGCINLLPKKEVDYNRVKVMNTDDYHKYFNILMNMSKFTLNMNRNILKLLGV